MPRTTQHYKRDRESSRMSRLIVRPSTAEDVATVAAIYRWHVAHGTGTFEIDPPDDAEMSRRRDDVLAKGLPWLVLEQAGAVIGYASANQFRPRPGYRFALEDSVYLADGFGGRGLGRLLLT